MNSNSNSESAILAWSKYPEPDGTNYLEDDLSDETQVLSIFDDCKAQQAIILREGWEYLFNEYGLIDLLKIDALCGWLQQEDEGERIVAMVYQSLIAGFHPLLNEFGDYDESESIFLLEDGNKLKVDWEEIYDLKDEINSSE